MKHEHNFLLRRERELRGWSLQKVADELHRLFQDSNATAADIGRWERGVRAPSPFYREKLCILYGKGADELGLIKIADSDEYSRSTSAKRAFSTSVKEQFLQNEQNEAVSRPAESLLEEWGEAPHVGSFYGRNQESAKLEKWIIDEHCRVVAILGIGGIGKTALTKTVVEHIKNHFEYIFWRSLQHAPPLKNVLRDCIVFLSHQKQMEIPQDEDDQISLLIEYLRNRRCLLVLDNAESILREGYSAGHYREGYEGYGKLVQCIGEIPLQSCLLLTSREKLKELIRLEGNISPIHSLHLLGLKEEEGKAILKDEGVFGSQKAWKDLIRRYTGNPLALKLVAEPIRELFGGDIAEFLKEEGALVDNNVYTLLHQQFLRLSELEQDILYWLAIEREAIVLEEIRTDLVRPTSKRELLSALTSLRQRSMIEINGVARFTLQPVIMEYVTDRLLEEIYKEIETEKLHFFSSHALIKANTKDYLRYSQIQFILQPLVYKMYALLGRIGIVKRLMQILSVLRDTNSQVPSYAAGNVLNLLIQSHVNLRGYDFSHLVIWEAYLQGVSLPEVNFAHADLERSVFTDTFGGVFSVAFSPGGDLLAGGIANGEVRLWYVKGTPRYVLHGHTDWVRSVAFSPDGRVVASGSYDQTVRLWEVSTGRCLKTLQGHTGRVYSVTFAPDGTMVASGSGDQTIRLWNTHTGESLRTLYGHSDAVHCIAFGPDKNTIVSGSGDQTIRLWNTHTGQCLHIFHGHSGAILTVALSPDGELLASGSEDQTIKIWEVSTGQCIETLSEYTNQIWSVIFGRGKNAFLYGSEDQYIKMWEVSKEQCLKVLQGHSNKIWSLALSPDGELLASGSEDQTIKIWDVNTGQCLKTFQGYSNWVYTVAFSPDGKTLISGGQESYIHLWSINNNKREKTLQGHESWIYTVVFSPDGKTLASGSEDQTIKIWEVSTGQCLKTLQGHSSWVRSVVFSPDGKTLASGSEDNTIRIWDLHMGQCMRILYGHSSWVRSVVFSPDGKSIISGSEDQTIRIWDVDTGQCRSILRGHTSRIYSVAVSSNGLVVASGSGDGTIKLWEVSTETLLKTLQGHSTWVRSIAFSPDGKNLVSGSADQTIRIWEGATGECIRILQGHSSWVYSVAFNFDGKIIASGSGDGTIKLWNIHTGMCIMTLRNDRPYERMNITQVKGVTLTRKAALKALGAIEEVKEVSNHG